MLRPATHIRYHITAILAAHWVQFVAQYKRLGQPGVLSGFLDVAYHHLIMAIPWQLRIVIIMNRKAGLNLLVHGATEAIQQWARDIKKMRMGILIVIHTFGADMKWHPHIHLIVTGGGLSLDGKRWIETDPKFLMHHGGLKKRWK